MTKEEIENIKKNKRWTITFADIYSRYFFIIFPLAIVFIGSIMTISGFKNNVTDLRIAAIIILTIGLFLTGFVVRRLYQNQVFERFQIIDLTNEKVDYVLKATGMDNVKFHKLGYFTATTNVSWFSWGEQITIIVNDNELLINSRPTGSSFSFQPITIFKDKKNIRTIINELTIESGE
jgi:uncharacterized membrane protein (DUF485 family)